MDRRDERNAARFGCRRPSSHAHLPCVVPDAALQSRKASPIESANRSRRGEQPAPRSTHAHACIPQTLTFEVRGHRSGVLACPRQTPENPHRNLEASKKFAVSSSTYNDNLVHHFARGSSRKGSPKWHRRVSTCRRASPIAVALKSLTFHADRHCDRCSPISTGAPFSESDG